MWFSHFIFNHIFFVNFWKDISTNLPKAVYKTYYKLLPFIDIPVSKCQIAIETLCEVTNKF